MRAPARPVIAEEPEAVQLLDGTLVGLLTVELGCDAASGDDCEALIADDAYGRTVGCASFTRVYGPRAQLELDVDAALWHLGLPALLLDRLRERAARLGITTFIASIPAADVRLLALLRERFGALESRDGAWVHVELATVTAAVSRG